MSFPDDLPYDWDTWLNGPRTDSLALGSLIGPGPSRFTTLLGIARHLKLDPEKIDNEGFYVLDRLVSPLGDVLEEDPGDWVSDVLALRGDHVAREAVGDITSLDALHGALVQFGFQNSVIGRAPRVRHLLEELREALIRELARRVYQLLDDWRLRGSWERAQAARMPKGLVRADSRNLKAV